MEYCAPRRGLLTSFRPKVSQGRLAAIFVFDSKPSITIILRISKSLLLFTCLGSLEHGSDIVKKIS